MIDEEHFAPSVVTETPSVEALQVSKKPSVEEDETLPEQEVMPENKSTSSKIDASNNVILPLPQHKGNDPTNKKIRDQHTSRKLLQPLLTMMFWKMKRRDREIKRRKS